MGQTWERADEGMGGWSVNHLLEDRNHIMYAATDAGVWRTTRPVSSSEPVDGPIEAPVSLTVRPNPAGDFVSVVLAAAEPGDAIVTVFDTQGREVARVFSGAIAAGERSFDIDTSGWAAGVYVVRAEMAGRVASARLVVGR